MTMTTEKLCELMRIATRGSDEIDGAVDTFRALVQEQYALAERALEPQGQALPELPEPWIRDMDAPEGSRDHFAADQMRDFFAQGFAAGRASQLALPAGPVPEGDALDAQRYRKAVAHGVIVLHNGAKACVGKDEADAALDAIAPLPAVTQPVADERAEFEAWYGIKNFEQVSLPDGRRYYVDARVDFAWIVWQAASAALCQPAEEGDKA